MQFIKTVEEIELMRAAGSVVHRVLTTLGAALKPGISTGELDDMAADIITRAGGTSPFLGYAPGGHPPYPAWTCISLNEEIVHGIPGRRTVMPGDIVSIDCGVELNGWVGDSAWTFPVGDISPAAEKLLKVTQECLFKGIAAAKPGKRLGDIGHAVQKHAESHGYSVVRELTGHGVGRTMHEGDLQVANYGSGGRGPLIQQGMTFAIEPMINMGRKDIRCEADHWTITTADRSLAAHFEHTVAIMEHGAQILTNGE